jgi:hypothetical protein
MPGKYIEINYLPLFFPVISHGPVTAALDALFLLPSEKGKSLRAGPSIRKAACMQPPQHRYNITVTRKVYGIHPL